MVKNCDYGQITTSSVIKQFLLENPPLTYDVPSYKPLAPLSWGFGDYKLVEKNPMKTSWTYL